MKAVLFIQNKVNAHPVRSIVLGVLIIVITTIGIILIGNVLDHIAIISAFDGWIYEKLNLGPHPAWLNTIVSPFNFNFLPWGGTFIPSFLYFVFALGFIFIIIFDPQEFKVPFLEVKANASVNAVLGTPASI